MHRDIVDYMRKCDTCQQVKFEHRKLSGLLRHLKIPKWKWDHISMDFVEGLPNTKRNHNSIWVIVDRLRKLAHFIPIHKDNSVKDLRHIYMDQVVSHHSTPSAIVSDIRAQFISHL